MLIGIISDTHGYLDPRVPLLFRDVEHILHAGDIGSMAIPLTLERIAPVTAVLGNTDTGLNFRETEVVSLAGRKFLVHHIVDAREPHEDLRRRLEREKPDVVVFGHTHKPHNEVVGATLFFNPGYAGKARFNLPRSVALMHLGTDGMKVEFQAL